MKTKSGVFNKKKKWLSSFYGLTMYFIQNFLLFLFLFLQYEIFAHRLAKLIYSHCVSAFPHTWKDFMLVILPVFLLFQFVLKV